MEENRLYEELETRTYSIRWNLRILYTHTHTHTHIYVTETQIVSKKEMMQ
jgi:hypothetical protein